MGWCALRWGCKTVVGLYGCVVLGDEFLLWPAIMFFKLGMQLELNFTVLSLKIFFSGLVLWKLSFNILRNFLTMFVFTFRLKGGLNQIIFRFLLRFVPLLLVGWYVSLWWYPLFCSAVWYGGAIVLNTPWLHEISESRLFMLMGMFLIMAGGWLDLVWTYCGMLLDFINGQKVVLARSRVILRKSNIFLLASMVILRWCSLNILHISFFIHSICCGVLLNAANPSSRYRPIDLNTFLTI